MTKRFTLNPLPELGYTIDDQGQVQPDGSNMTELDSRIKLLEDSINNPINQILGIDTSYMEKLLAESLEKREGAHS